jgi:hypothetical protein
MLTIYPYPLPPAQTPIVDPQTGALTSKDGRYLILALLNRTGGSSGAPSVGVGLVVVAGTPFNIVNDWSEFDTVPAGGIAVIPELTVGAEIIVFNGGVADLHVTPQPDTQIDALGLGGAYSLTNLKMQVFRCFAPQQIRSMQLG